MDLFLRPVRLSDAQEINEMRRQKEVRARVFALTTETIDFTEEFLKSMGGDDHVLIAGLDGKFVGMVGIHLLKSIRQRHSAFPGIMGRVRKLLINSEKASTSI